MTKKWLVIIILILYVAINCLGELFRWQIPIWAALIDIVIGVLILYWAYRMSSYF